jgi:hypothetical protein
MDPRIVKNIAGEERDFLLLQGFESHIVQPVV